MGMLKRTIDRLARRAGYEIIPDWRMPRLAHARKLQRLVRELEIGTVLDVGANTGQFRDFLRLEVGFAGTIHSFEPISALCEAMERRRSADPAWTIHRFALGAEDQERDINVMGSTVFSSFLEPDRETVPEFVDLNTVARTERVKVRTLDEVARSALGGVDLRRAFLKLDTQGFDLEVLKGGAVSIAVIPLLQMEISIVPIYAGMPDFSAALAAFTARGFSIADFFLVTEDKRLRAVEFDCLMVRADRGDRS